MRNGFSKAALFVPCGQGGLLVSGVLKMKRSVSLAVRLLVKLGSCLAACVGCSTACFQGELAVVAQPRKLSQQAENIPIPTRRSFTKSVQ